MLGLPTLVTALAYKGRAGEAYSPLNHFVSELGLLGVSKLAPVFNVGFVLGGILLAIFLLALGSVIGTSLGRITGGLGAYSGLSCSFLGILPMNYILPHIAAGDLFFLSGLTFMILMAAAILLDPAGTLPSWLAYFGCAVAVSFIVFLYMLLTIRLPQDEVLFPTGVERPKVLPLSLIEWSVYLMILGWVIAASLAYSKAVRSKEVSRESIDFRRKGK